MKDRIAGAPGRYSAIVPVADLENFQTGNSFEITLVRDDDPEEAGTPYNKESVLPDDLAADLCADYDDPTPADAFRALLARCSDNEYNLYDHKEDAGNPHGVTCDQIGAAPESYVMAAEEGINGRIDDHLADTTNPHAVTCEQIGAVTQAHHGDDIQMVMDEIALQVENLELYISDRVGDIETALDSIIAIQNDLIGGDDV